MTTCPERKKESYRHYLHVIQTVYRGGPTQKKKKTVLYTPLSPQHLGML